LSAVGGIVVGERGRENFTRPVVEVEESNGCEQE